MIDGSAPEPRTTLSEVLVRFENVLTGIAAPAVEYLAAGVEEIDDVPTNLMPIYQWHDGMSWTEIQAVDRQMSILPGLILGTPMRFHSADEARALAARMTRSGVIDIDDWVLFSSDHEFIVARPIPTGVAVVAVAPEEDWSIRFGSVPAFFEVATTAWAEGAIVWIRDGRYRSGGYPELRAENLLRIVDRSSDANVADNWFEQ